MKTMKNKLLSALAIVMALSVSVFALTFFGDNAVKVSAAGDGELVAGQNYQCDLTKDSYDIVTFEYKITNDGYFQLAIMEDWSNFYAYFKFDSAGYTGACKSVSTRLLEDGYVAVTMDVSEGNDLGTATYSSGHGALQQSFIFIRGDWSDANGYIRNVEFSKHPVLPDLEMVEGASVRLSEPYGIRFKANVPAALVADEGISYGMTIIPYDWVAKYSLSGDYIAKLDAESVTYRKFECEPLKDGDDYYIQASLTNILAKNLSRKFIGIAWYEKDGIKHYAFNDNCVRSISDVAAKAIAAGSDYSAAEEEFLYGSTVKYEYTGEYIITETGKATVGEQVIEFYYKRKAEGGNVRFAVINGDDWNTGFYGYFSIAADNTINAAGVAVTAENNGWYKVTLDPSAMTVKTADPSGFTWFNTVFFNGGTASFDVIGLSVAKRPAHPAPEVFTATAGLTKNFTSGAYSTISFDYKITTGAETYFQLAILNEGWGSGIGYFKFNPAGTVEDYAGVSTTEDKEGYIHVTISVAEVNKPFGAGKPETFSVFFIRGDWSTAGVCYLDNLKFE